MGKTFWNRRDSIPVFSLNPEQLRVAIAEWSEGSEALEKLLWMSYQKRFETAGSHVGYRDNYFEFYTEPKSRELIHRILAATEKHGNSEALIMFGKEPTSGPNWCRTTCGVSASYPERADMLFSSLTEALKADNYLVAESAFLLMEDLWSFFEGKMTGLYIRMSVKNYSEYELRLEAYKNQRIWNHLDEILCQCGMIHEDVPEEPEVQWSLRAHSREAFAEAVRKVIDALQKNWKIETPTEFTEDMTFELKALIMQKRFGTSAEGVELMNDWINTNHPNPRARKVSY